MIVGAKGECSVYFTNMLDRMQVSFYGHILLFHGIPQEFSARDFPSLTSLKPRQLRHRSRNIFTFVFFPVIFGFASLPYTRVLIAPATNRIKRERRTNTVEGFPSSSNSIVYKSTSERAPLFHQGEKVGGEGGGERGWKEAAAAAAPNTSAQLH